VLEQKTVVIVGMGVAGTRLASVCKALEMTVYGVSRTDREIDGVDRMFDREQLTAAAAAADYLVLALPHDSDSHELIDAEVLAAMKPTAFLVNIARGAVVDEQALVAALETGALAGAGLDVTAPEPPARDSPLWRLDNVVLTPHIAGRSDRYDEHALEVVIPNVGRYLNGERDLLNVISDPDVVASSQP
jgi:phosphoglycerate dehydrogenase-like enzyme